MAHPNLEMTVSEQKEIFRQALALPEKARLDLYNRLCKSLGAHKKGDKAVPGARVVAELTAVYGGKKAPRRPKGATSKTEVVSKKEWNGAWKTELEKRIADVDSGRVRCVPYAEVRRKLDRILGKV